MALDRISEDISHFVGLFNLETEAAKMRLDYQSFKLESEARALEVLMGESFSGHSEFALRDYNPSLETATPQDAGQPLVAPEVTSSAAEGPRTDNWSPMAFVPDASPAMAQGAGISMSNPNFTIMPNSIVLSVQQIARLVDNDLLVFEGTGDFVAPAQFLTMLQDLGTFAQSLNQIDPWHLVQTDEAAFDAAMQVYESLDSVAALPIADLQTTLLRADDAEGIFVNGARIDEAPDVNDLLPVFLQEDEVTDEQSGAPDMPSDGVTDYDPGPFAVDPGHHVVTGGNRVINEAVLKSVWVDAPVIAVADNVLRLDMISQINLRVESAALPLHAISAPSSSFNIAHLEYSYAMVQDPSVTDSTDVINDGLPSFWNVTRLEGDLILSNWVQQHIFATDYDRVEVKFTGAASYIGTGENLVFNETLAMNMGFHYDLIMIGGSMVTLNQIFQINVMLDQDSFTNGAFAGAAFNAGDNLQVNKAAILTTGVDSTGLANEPFLQAITDLKAGSNTISADVAQMSLFAGQEMLSVLYVDGDLIQTAVIEQISYLGDSDQIHFIQNMIASAEGAQTTVTTGSNAQINAATIVSEGLDSTVLAGGETYSDALIYQAELIDETSAPTGVHLDPLASEAVAFLADNMIAPDPVDEGAGHGVLHQDDPGTSDVMQTMLA